MINKRMVELLSPAGSFESMKAAAQAGCDAVYIGGTRFGARAFAKNADTDALLSAIDYMHIRGKKLYLTVNTLLKEKEIDELYDYIEPLYRQGLDAAIVQDAGALRFLHRNFPGLALHASTQMTLTMADGANLLRDYGVTRLVPARELTLPELVRMRRDTDLEIETFIHGAMCYCYSGQCLMSSLIGGRSGNRGRCAQTCRLEYETEGRRGYLLSMKDMCTLSVLPELMDSGIDSFKIEGRMKREEYVAGVTSIYRKYMDRYETLGRQEYRKYISGHPDEFREDLRVLEELYNRGGFSEGYYHTKKGLSMMAADRPNHTGIPAGRVERVMGIRAEIRLDVPVREGDVLEIRGGKKEYSFTVGEGQFVSGKGKQNYLAVNCSPQAGIVPKLSVWRIKNETLLRQISRQYLETEKRLAADGVFTARIGSPCALEVIRGTDRVSLKGEIVQAAKSSPVSEERIREQLNKTGGASCFFRTLTLCCDEGIFLSIKGLNELRRQALLKLDEAAADAYRRMAPCREAVTEKPDISRPESTGIDLSAVVGSREQLDAALAAGVKRIYLDSGCFGRKGALAAAKEAGAFAQCYIRLPHIFRCDTFDAWSEMVPELSDSSVAGFLIRNLEELAFLAGNRELAKKPFHMDYNMYVMNREAERMAAEFGAERYTVSPELNESELAQLDLSRAVAVVYGRLPLMVSSQCLWRNTSGCQPGNPGIRSLTDRKGCRFPVIKDCETCSNTILNSVPLSLLDSPESIKRPGITQVRLDFTTEDARSVRQITAAFLQVYKNGEETEFVFPGFTRGHLKRGVD